MAERSLDLPLKDGPGGVLWAERAAADDSVWPGLWDALSEAGVRQLTREIVAAHKESPDSPEPVLRIVEAFMRTSRLRRGPGYEERMEAMRSRQGGER